MSWKTEFSPEWDVPAVIAENPRVERCDECQKFKNDFEAATAFLRSRTGRRYRLNGVTVELIPLPLEIFRRK